MIAPERTAADPYLELRAALVALAAEDRDHASTRNARGFSKFDGEFGHSLARQPHWSLRQAAAAYRMLRKYRVQLEDLGYPFEQIPLPQAVFDVMHEVGEGERIENRAPATCVFDGTGFVIQFPYNPTATAEVKRIPGRRWDAERKAWTIPTAAGMELLAFVKRHRIEAQPKAAHALRELELRTEASTATDADINIPTLRGELRPFQRAGVQYLTRAKRTLLADAPGLGKTIQMLAAAEMLDAYPLICVVPASLRLNWAAEAKKWLPHRTVEITTGTRAENPLFQGYTAEIVIVGWDVIWARVPDLRARKPKGIVFDESHMAKGATARRTRAAIALAEGIDFRVCASGTPILNRAGELLTQLEILGRLDYLGGARHFQARYLGAGANLRELNQRLRSTMLVRRLKEDVLKELPPKQYVRVPLEIQNRAEYEYAKAELIRWIKEQAMTDAEFTATLPEDLSAAERQTMLEAHAEDKADRARRAEVLVRLEKLKTLAARGKLPAVKAWLKDFLASGEKCIAFASHIEIQKALLEDFPDAARLLGEDDTATRDANVRRFQQDPACKLIVCSIAAGGLGITLTAASNVVIMEFPWNPGTLDQCIDRAHRIGQRDSVTAWYMLASNTVDEDIAELIDSKRLIVDSGADGRVSTGAESIQRAVLASLVGLESATLPADAVEG